MYSNNLSELVLHPFLDKLFTASSFSSRRMSYIYFSWLNSILLYEVMPTLDDFSSSSTVVENAGEAFLIS